jgi:hypothetical protein
LVSGELALNLTDKKVFTKDGSGNVVEITPSPTNALAVASGGTGATSAASARTNLDALAATNPSYTGTLTGGTGVVNLGSGQFVKDASGNVTVNAGTLGYGTGAGGTVTQVTSKATAVTLNKPSGSITMHNAALAAGAEVYFNLNNTNLTVADGVLLTSEAFGSRYRVECAGVTTGIVTIRVTNVTGSSFSDALVINFAVFKGATA